MKEYVTRLKLRYDPFEPASPSRNFFKGAERDQLLHDLLELALEQELLATITGPLGSGKSTLAREFVRTVGDDAVCLHVQATLFMNRAQFLEALGKQLPKHRHIGAMPSVAASASRLCELASDLDMEAQALVIVIDDAHELAAEVLELLGEVYLRSARARVRVLLFGENALLNLVASAMPEVCKDEVRYFALPAFTIEDTRSYIEFKLAHAGLAGPLPLAGGVVGRIHNAAGGIPAAINALTVEALDPAASPAVDDFADDTHFISTAPELEYSTRDFTQIDLDMSEPETAVAPESHAAPGPGLRTIAMGALFRDIYGNQRYWIAASLLIVVMLITVAVWDGGESAATGAIVSNGQESVNRIQLPVPTTAATLASAADPVAAAAPTTTAVASAPVSASVQPPQPPAAVGTTAVTAADTPVAAAAPTGTAPALAAAPAAAVVTRKPVAANTPAKAPLTGGTAYEQQLLAQPPGNYTIQLLGSHAEASVQSFIASSQIGGKSGYFETRYQNKPWFVAVSGSFADRAAAAAAIARLPESIRKLQPWVRPLADIQADIRELRQP